MEFISKIFVSDPGQAFNYYIPMLVLSIGLLIASAIASRVYDKKKRTDFAYKRIFKNLSKTMGLFGGLFLLLTGIRHESIPYFSMRLWLYTSVLVFLYFIYRYVNKFRTDYPREKQNVNNLQQRKQKEEKVYSTSKKKHRH